ncbi:MAG: hypothetical protein A2143_02325 [Gallionellales bacterium RBG_16_57_15]|nr:MAG: hypothetical protein A2143_02325 [Gallionellales bacterium RBG_16_57_15]
MAAETKITITAATAQAEANLRGLGSTVDGMSGKLRGMVGLLGGALSVGAFGAFIKSSIDAADELSKLAQKTGTSVEALAGLKFAADQNGTSLESVANAAKKLSAQMVDKPDLFERMGITAKDSTGALVQMADIFASMPDGVEKTALAVKLMGKSGEEMIPFLNQGSAALAEYVEQGKKYIPITAESAKQAELFNDQLDELKTAAAGAGVAMSIDLLPIMTQIGSAMTLAARESGLLKSLWVGLGGLGAALFTDDLLERSAQIEKRLKSINAEIKSAEGMRGVATPVSMPLRIERGQLEAELAALQKAAAAAPVAAAKPPVDSGKGRALLRALGGVDKGGKPKAEKPFDPEDDFWFAVDEAAMKNQQKRNEEYLRDLVKAEDEASQAMQRSALEAQRIIADIDPIYKVSLAWEELSELVDKGLLTAEQAGQSYAKTFGEATEQMTTFAEQAGRNIQDAFAEFLFDPFKGGLNGMLDGFQTMLRKMAAEALASQILGSIGSWGKTGGGAGSFLGGIAASVFGGAKAIGGPVSGGTTYLVGERGPELFTPSSSGNITPNDKMGKSVTVINNFTISTPADRRTQEQIAAMAGASIQTAMMRGA